MKVLIVYAATNSEWDGVSFAAIELTESHLAFLKSAQQKAIAIKEEGDSFMHLSYSGDMADFYIDEDELPEGIVPKEDEPIVVEIDAAVMDKLTKPEQVIRHGEIRIYPGSVIYVGNGKHTDEEYWTGMIPFETIFK